MRSLWKQPMFVIGFSFMAFMLIVSFGYTLIFHDSIRKFFYLVNSHQKITEAAPLHPRWYLPFGTDAQGYDMLAKMIIGAKFTILASAAVALLRMILAIPIGFFLGTYINHSRKYVNGLVDPIHYFPLTIIAFYLLSPILSEYGNGFSHSLFVRMGIEVVILAVLTVPISSTLIGNEAAIINRQEYVESAKTLGAGRIRLIRKHIYPVLREKLFIMFGQEVLQTLIVLSHLGVLELYFGGSKVRETTMGHLVSSITYEWSGLIGGTRQFIYTAPWIPLTPIIFFALTMLSVAFMIEGYVRATSGKSHYFRRKKVNIKDTEINKKFNKEKAFNRYNRTG
jgi:peptide/nickel transport system permease protein